MKETQVTSRPLVLISHIGSYLRTRSSFFFVLFFLLVSFPTSLDRGVEDRACPDLVPTVRALVPSCKSISEDL